MFRDDLVLDRVRAHLEVSADQPESEYVGPEDAAGAVLPGLGATAQLLVLGSRGRDGFASLLLGATGMAAARDAECPVVVVPRPGREVDGEAPGVPARAWSSARRRGSRLARGRRRGAEDPARAWSSA